MGLHSKGIEKTSSSLPVKFPYSFMPTQKRQVRFDNAQIAIQGSKAQVSPLQKVLSFMTEIVDFSKNPNPFLE